MYTCLTLHLEIGIGIEFEYIQVYDTKILGTKLYLAYPHVPFFSYEYGKFHSPYNSLSIIRLDRLLLILTKRLIITYKVKSKITKHSYNF